MEGSRHWEPAAGLGPTAAPWGLGVSASPGPTWQAVGRCRPQSVWGAVVVTGQGERQEPCVACSGEPSVRSRLSPGAVKGHIAVGGPQCYAGSRVEAALKWGTSGRPLKPSAWGVPQRRWMEGDADAHSCAPSRATSTVRVTGPTRSLGVGQGPFNSVGFLPTRHRHQSDREKDVVKPQRGKSATSPPSTPQNHQGHLNKGHLRDVTASGSLRSHDDCMLCGILEQKRDNRTPE